MTSVFGADGKNIPCTVIEAGPCVVTQLRTVEKDGYEAVQLAYDEIKEIHASEPLKGHLKKAYPHQVAASVSGKSHQGNEVSFVKVFSSHVASSDTVTHDHQFTKSTGNLQPTLLIEGCQLYVG